MKTKISELCENSVKGPLPLIDEPRFSCLIKSEDTTLFDAGRSLGILNNMGKMRKTS